MAKAESPVLVGYSVAEFKVGFDFPGFDPLPVVPLDEHVMVSRHALSDEEVEEIVRTREVFVAHPRDAKRVLPIEVLAMRPEYTLRVLHLQLGPGRRALCHGLEVADAGGSEAERGDYAATEAAQLLAQASPLPARVALLPAGKPWMEGGQDCKTRDELEEAILRRLKKVLDSGEQRVEVRAAAAGPDIHLRALVAEMTPRAIREAEAVSVPG